jgi:hypothetical protein
MIRPDWTFQQVRGLLTYARSVLGLDARIIQLHDCFKPYTKVDRSLGDPVQIFGVGVGGSADQGLIFTNAGASEFLRLIMSGVIPFTYPDRMVESIREFAPALNEKCLFTLNPVVEPMMFDWGNSMTTNEITVSYKKVR